MPRAKFGRVLDAMLASEPSRLARAEGALSAARPAHYLSRTHALGLRAPPLVDDVPAAIRVILRAQDERGRWHPSDELTRALGGRIPAPPHGVSEWRWCTACALVYLRRHPESLAHTEDACTRGLEVLDSQATLSMARKALPPEDCYFHLDAELVRAGRWRESETLLMGGATGGYLNFLPEAHPDVERAALETTVAAPDEPDPAALAEAWRAAREDKLREDEVQKALANDYRRLVEKRTAKAKPRPQWEGRTQATEFSASKSQPLSAAAASTRRRRNTAARAASLASSPGETSSVHRLGERSARDVPAAKGKDQAAASPEVSAASSNVVQKCMALDQYVDDIRECLRRALRMFRAAKRHSERQHAFEELSAMLGPRLTARNGYTDWRGRGVEGLQSMIIEAIDALIEWRAVVRAHHPGAEPPPFHWNSRNFLLHLPHYLDFLAGCKELVEWYGPDFPFFRNPFMLAVPIDQRPPTPRSAMVTVIIDEEKIEQISEVFLKERQQQQLRVDEVDRQLANAPRWWPSHGDADHMRRLRAAEKVMLEEEALEKTRREKLEAGALAARRGGESR